MRMSAPDLIAHHTPTLSVSGTAVVVQFADPGPAQAFFEQLESVAAIKATASADEEASERQDDLRELAHLHARLTRAENAIRTQRRRTNMLQAAFAERFGRYPSYCCQRCGEQIGWIGRAFQAVGVALHSCRVEGEER